MIATGQDVVSAGFVTPYPPGFPVLVPGQLITERILDYMDALDTREIHGYDSREGYRIFTDAALNTCSDAGGRLNP
jgi:arginine decarboxylase